MAVSDWDLLQTRKMQENLARVGKCLLHHNLVMKRLPEITNNLFSAISDALFFTTCFHEDVQRLCIRHLKILLQSKGQLGVSKPVIEKFQLFLDNPSLFTDYCNNLTLPGFEKVFHSGQTTD